VRRLKADLAAIYPQLADVEVEHAWSGVLGNALHRMPQIGEVSGGLWLASGFGGQGINTTAMAGNLLAQAIVEGDDTWRLFAPFGLVWAGRWGRRCRGGSTRASGGRQGQGVGGSRKPCVWQGAPPGARGTRSPAGRRNSALCCRGSTCGRSHSAATSPPIRSRPRRSPLL